MRVEPGPPVKEWIESALNARAARDKANHNPLRTTSIIKRPAAWLMSQMKDITVPNTDPTGQMTFAVGHAIESIAVRLLYEAGHPLIGRDGMELAGNPETDRQEEVMVTVGVPPYVITVPGHLDGRWPGLGLADVKSMSTFAFERLCEGIIDEGYLEQFGSYMRAAKEDRLHVIGIRKERSNFECRTVFYDEGIMHELDLRVADMLIAKEALDDGADRTHYLKTRGWCVPAEETYYKKVTGRVEARQRTPGGMPTTYCAYAAVCPLVGGDGYQFLIDGGKPKWVKVVGENQSKKEY